MEERVVATNVCIAMKKTYDLEFNQEIERILKEIYFRPIRTESGDKRAVVITEYKYLQFLKENDLANILNSHGGGKYGLILRLNGHEVFEKYKGWDDYRKKVIDKKNKIEKAKNLAQRFWWLPIIISVIALLIAIFKHN